MIILAREGLVLDHHNMPSGGIRGLFIKFDNHNNTVRPVIYDPYFVYMELLNF